MGILAGELLADPLLTQALAALSHGHELFDAGVSGDQIRDMPAQLHARADWLARAARSWRLPAATAGPIPGLHRMADSDSTLARVVAAGRADHAHAHAATRAVLQDARADADPGADTPIGRREAMARMAARLRAQHGHVARARSRARLLAQRMRRLRYQRHWGPGSTGHAAVVAAIRQALTIKGIHDPMARSRWERGMDVAARRESNYDAAAVNGWDANALRGTPSRGAWQFIAPTFAAYHEPGTSHKSTIWWHRRVPSSTMRGAATVSPPMRRIWLPGFSRPIHADHLRGIENATEFVEPRPELRASVL